MRTAYAAVLLLALLGTGCTGTLVDRLNERHVRSCIWWSGLGARGVSATGGADLATCLDRTHTWP